MAGTDYDGFRRLKAPEIVAVVDFPGIGVVSRVVRVGWGGLGVVLQLSWSGLEWCWRRPGAEWSWEGPSSGLAVAWEWSSRILGVVLRTVLKMVLGVVLGVVSDWSEE